MGAVLKSILDHAAFNGVAKLQQSVEDGCVLIRETLGLYQARATGRHSGLCGSTRATI